MVEVGGGRRAAGERKKLVKLSGNLGAEPRDVGTYDQLLTSWAGVAEDEAPQVGGCGRGKARKITEAAHGEEGGQCRGGKREGNAQLLVVDAILAAVVVCGADGVDVVEGPEE